MMPIIKPLIIGTVVLLATELLFEPEYKKPDLPHTEYGQDKTENIVDVYRFLEQQRQRQKQNQNIFCDAQLVTLIDFDL